MGEANQQESPTQATSQTATESAVVIDLRQLLQGKKEVWIEHAGVRYRLRVTRRNRLILQK
jgi:hemin uptake protein HemP